MQAAGLSWVFSAPSSVVFMSTSLFCSSITEGQNWVRRVIPMVGFKLFNLLSIGNYFYTQLSITQVINNYNLYSLGV